MIGLNDRQLFKKANTCIYVLSVLFQHSEYFGSLYGAFEKLNVTVVYLYFSSPSISDFGVMCIHWASFCHSIYYFNIQSTSVLFTAHSSSSM